MIERMTLKGSWYDDTKKNDTQRLPQGWHLEEWHSKDVIIDTKKNDTTGYCIDET